MKQVFDSYPNSLKTHFQPIMELIINESLKLVTVKAEHSQELFDLVEKNRAYLDAWFSWVGRTQTEESMRQYLVQKEKEIEEERGLDFCIVLDNHIIGKIGFNKWNKNHYLCDIAYWIDENEQGKGITTKCCKTLIEYAFKNLNINRIEIGARMSNKASLAIPQKLGFTHEGTLREVEFNNGKFHTAHTYALLKSDWLKM